MPHRLFCGNERIVQQFVYHGFIESDPPVRQKRDRQIGALRMPLPDIQHIDLPLCVRLSCRLLDPAERQEAGASHPGKNLADKRLMRPIDHNDV